MRLSNPVEINNTRRRAGTGMIISFAFVVAGFLLLEGTIFQPEHYAIGMAQYWTAIKSTIIISGVMFAGGWLGAFINGIIFLRAGRENVPTPPPHEPRPARAPDNLMLFEQRMRATRVDPETNQIVLSKYPFTTRQWHTLVIELRRIRYGWNKSALEKTRIFTQEFTGASLTATGVYGDICEDFARMEWIEGGMSKWKMTEFGIQSLHKLAKMGVITA